MKLRTKDYKEHWTLEEAQAECGEFGSYDIIEPECYFCEKEEPVLAKWCKSIQRLGGLEEYLKSLKGVDKDKKEKMESEADKNKLLKKVNKEEELDELTKKGLEVLRNIYRRDKSKVREVMEKLVKEGCYFKDFKKIYKRNYLPEAKELCKSGFDLVKTEDEKGIFYKLVWKGK